LAAIVHECSGAASSPHSASAIKLHRSTPSRLSLAKAEGGEHRMLRTLDGASRESLNNCFAILQWCSGQCGEDRRSRILPARKVALRVTSRDLVSLRELISASLGSLRGFCRAGSC